MRARARRSGNPIQNIKDYGVEVGGPIGGKRVGLGQLRQAGRQGRRRRLLQADAGVPGLQDRRGGAGGADRGRQWLPEHRPRRCCCTTNLKAEVQLFKGNRLSIYNNFAKKERNARGAGDLTRSRPPRRRRRWAESFGKYRWDTGPNPTYKFGNQRVFTDRLLVDVQYAHVGNNFTLGLPVARARTTAADASMIRPA